MLQSTPLGPLLRGAPVVQKTLESPLPSPPPNLPPAAAAAGAVVAASPGRQTTAGGLGAPRWASLARGIGVTRAACGVGVARWPLRGGESERMVPTVMQRRWAPGGASTREGSTTRARGTGSEVLECGQRSFWRSNRPSLGRGCALTMPRRRWRGGGSGLAGPNLDPIGPDLGSKGLAGARQSA
jgi:hypothetical protein